MRANIVKDEYGKHCGNDRYKSFLFVAGVGEVQPSRGWWQSPQISMIASSPEYVVPLLHQKLSIVIFFFQAKAMDAYFWPSSSELLNELSEHGFVASVKRTLLSVTHNYKQQ